LSSHHWTDAQRPQTCLASTQALRSQHVSSASKIQDCIITHRSERCTPPVRPVRSTGQTCPMLLHLRLRFFGLGFVNNQGTQWFSSEPLEAPRTRCSPRQFIVGTKNRKTVPNRGKSRTEPKYNETEKFGSCSVSRSWEPKKPRYFRFFTSVN
jgi:hypothetical protein